MIHGHQLWLSLVMPSMLAVFRFGAVFIDAVNIGAENIDAVKHWCWEALVLWTLVLRTLVLRNIGAEKHWWWEHWWWEHWCWERWCWKVHDRLWETVVCALSIISCMLWGTVVCALSILLSMLALHKHNPHRWIELWEVQWKAVGNWNTLCALSMSHAYVCCGTNTTHTGGLNREKYN